MESYKTPSTIPQEEVTPSIQVNTSIEFDSDNLISTTNNQQAMCFFGKITKKVMNYNQLYQFFINSNIKYKKQTEIHCSVAEESMLDTDLDKINDQQEYRIGIARKLCLNIPMTIHHASLAFQDDHGKFLIIGRQNAQFLKKSGSERSSSFAWWVVSHINFETIYNFTDTQMGNEKKYDFFPGSKFDVEMTNVSLTGAEIKSLIKAANDDICSRRYDVVHSNCYSAVFYGLAKAIGLIINRNNEDRVSRNEDLKSIFTLISSAFQDNYQLGLGGVDNSFIVNALGRAIKKLQELGVLAISRSPSPSPSLSPLNAFSRRNK